MHISEHDECSGDHAPDGGRGGVGDAAVAEAQRLERPVGRGQRVAQVLTSDVAEADVHITRVKSSLT